MDKKKIIIIVVAVAVVAAVIFFVMKGKKSKSLNDAALPDARGAMANDDDATYAAIRSMFEAQYPSDLSWIDDRVMERYTNPPATDPYLIKGVMTKTGAFMSVIGTDNPNPNGKFIEPATGAKLLWDWAVWDTMWKQHWIPFKTRNNKL